LKGGRKKEHKKELRRDVIIESIAKGKGKSGSNDQRVSHKADSGCQQMVMVMVMV